MAVSLISTEYIKQLAKVDEGATQAPQISGGNSAIICHSITDINLSDIGLFHPDKYGGADETTSSPKKGQITANPFAFYYKEAQCIAKLNDLLKVGRGLISNLYSYRSLSRCLPQVTPLMDATTKLELHEATYAILLPEIKKMTDFMNFRDASVQLVVDTMSSIAQECNSGTNGKPEDRDFFPSSGFLATLAQVLDMFVILDTMKNIKGSMNNDFSLFKRALPNIVPKKGSTDDSTVAYHRLYLFLGQQDQFSADLKKNLQSRVPQFEDIIADMANFCADSLERNFLLIPETRHSFLRATAFGLYLMDDQGDDRDITRKKRFKLARFQKIFKASPIVPLFADMPITLSTIYGKAPHLKFDDSVEGRDKELLSASYSLFNQIDRVRNECQSFLARFVSVKEETKAHLLHGPLSRQQNGAVYSIVLEGIKLLASCTGKVLENNAYKLANPASPEHNATIPESATAYELAIRYNYSAQDKESLIEFISIIKSLADILQNLEPFFATAVSSHMYLESQNFLKINVADYIAHATKKKRAVASILKVVRAIGLDGPLEELTEKSKKENRLSEITVVGRDLALSPSQLHLIRSLLDYSFSEKAKGMKASIMKEKDFRDHQVSEVETFIQESYFYQFMDDIQETVRSCSDLSSFWFKEFYLELSRKPQFPISMSLPWILTQHIFESPNAIVNELVFYPFEIYNDCAKKALSEIKSQHMYDEIVAEVNLCFDQFIFKLSEQIFLHFKRIGSQITLSSDFRQEVPNDSGDLPFSTFDSVLQQRNIYLLGRSIDVSSLLAYFMNQYLRKSLDVAISRFEGSDLTYITEFECLINANRKTHELLSKWLLLEDFDSMLADVNETNGTTFDASGRIFMHICFELINDVVPNYCHNYMTGRFIKSTMSFIEVPQRANFVKAPPIFLFGSKNLWGLFASQNSVYRQFIGYEHFESLSRLLGGNGVLHVLKELSSHVDALTNHTLTPYMKVINKGLSPSLKLPLFEYGVAGTYDFFIAHLKPLITYKFLHSEVFQMFREVGNSLLVVKMLSEVMEVENIFAGHIKAAFIPREDELTQKDLVKLQAADNYLGTGSSIFPFKDWVSKIEEEEKTVKNYPKLTETFLIHLGETLRRISQQWCLDDEEASTTTSSPVSAAAAAAQQPQQPQQKLNFHRIWSALQFAFSVGPNAAGKSEGYSGEKNSRELFGDSLPWAGCTIIYLLGQQGLFHTSDINMHLLTLAKSMQSFLSSTTSSGLTSNNNSSATQQQHQQQRGDVSKYLDSASFVKTLNEEVFLFLAHQAIW